MGFLIPPHPLTNFEIQKYYQNEPRFIGAFSRNNIPKKIKDTFYTYTFYGVSPVSCFIQLPLNLTFILELFSHISCEEVL